MEARAEAWGSGVVARFEDRSRDGLGDVSRDGHALLTRSGQGREVTRAFGDTLARRLRRLINVDYVLTSVKGEAGPGFNG